MTAPLSRETAIQNRLEAATPGPWEFRFHWLCVADQDGLDSLIAPFSENHMPSADLIANAPSDLAYLLAENEKLQSERKLLREFVRAVAPWAVHDYWGKYEDLVTPELRAALTDEGKPE